MVVGKLTDHARCERLDLLTMWETLVLPPFPWPKTRQWDRDNEASAGCGYWRQPLWTKLSGRIVLHNDGFTASTDPVVEKGEAASDLQCANGCHILERTTSEYGYWSQRIVIVSITVTFLLSTSARVTSICYVLASSSDAGSLGASLATAGDSLRLVGTGSISSQCSDATLCKIVLDIDGLSF